jgi:hypothetical protein
MLDETALEVSVRQLSRLTVTLCAPLVLGACWGVEGDGERERELRDHEDFVGIENHGELQVQVRQADTFRVAVSIDSNLLDNVKTRVRSDRLIIDQNVNFSEIVPGPHVIVDMPQLAFVKLLGSGDLDARTFDESATVRFELQGSGDLRFEGSAPRIDATLEGSGDLRLVGASDYLDVEVQGSGSVTARDLAASGAYLRTEGSGDINATVNGEVEAETDGSGDIDLYGDVDLVRSDEDGSGDIRVH